MDFVTLTFHCVPLGLSSGGNAEPAARGAKCQHAGVLSRWTTGRPNLRPVGAGKCSIHWDVFVLLHFYPPLVNSI